MEHDLNILMIFGSKENSIILTIRCIVVIAEHILKTGFVLQGHTYYCVLLSVYCFVFFSFIVALRCGFLLDFY